MPSRSLVGGVVRLPPAHDVVHVHLHHRVGVGDRLLDARHLGGDALAHLGQRDLDIATGRGRDAARGRRRQGLVRQPGPGALPRVRAPQSRAGGRWQRRWVGAGGCCGCGSRRRLVCRRRPSTNVKHVLARDAAAGAGARELADVDVVLADQAAHRRGHAHRAAIGRPPAAGSAGAASDSGAAAWAAGASLARRPGWASAPCGLRRRRSRLRGWRGLGFRSGRSLGGRVGRRASFRGGRLRGRCRGRAVAIGGDLGQRACRPSPSRRRAP